MENKKISPNFYLSDFADKSSGSIIDIPAALLSRLELLLAVTGKKRSDLTITSGYRTPEHNAEVGGAVNSQHLYGRAVDVKIAGLTPYQVAEVGKKLGFTGIGIYDTFTHLDVRPGDFAAWGTGSDRLKGVESTLTNAGKSNAFDSFAPLAQESINIDSGGILGKIGRGVVMVAALVGIVYIVLRATKATPKIEINKEG